MTVKIHHQGGAKVLLRTRPDNQAPLTDILLENGTEVFMVSWELGQGADDFVHVGCDKGHGWIRLRHLEIVEAGQLYKQLTDADWFQNHWQIRYDNCSIRVSKGQYDRDQLQIMLGMLGHEKAANTKQHEHDFGSEDG